jgi:DNA polymerase V
MGGIAALAARDEDLLYRMFGINAELMIDHAYGIETTEMSDIKGYKTKSNSLSHGQVLMRDYTNEEGQLIVKEMVEKLCHEMTEKGKVTPNVSIAVGYSNALHVPMAHGSVSFGYMTDAASVIMPAIADLYNNITNHEYPVRRIFVNFNDIKSREDNKQITLFDLTDAEAAEEGKTKGQMRMEGMADPIAETSARLKRDAALQEAVNSIRKKYGKDAMLRGMDLEEAATTRERNHQVGGHTE